MSESAPGTRLEPCAGAVLVEGEALLLVRRRNPPGRGRWSLPGGRVEAGETPAQAAARELYEETGIDAAIGDLLGTAVLAGRYLVYDFVATRRSPGEPVAGHDASEARFVLLRELASLPLAEGLLDWLRGHGLAVDGP
ncbi:MAG TPA: NUDIX domain-containing protein [Acidimicrobiales bacterium]|nr:NUDIX domain-containing protein [Acidimicrobiales bacterium]